MTMITKVYDTQITIFGWGYQPTNITGGPHPVWVFLGIFHSCLYVYQRVNLHFPMVFLWCSHFPMVFLWFSYGFRHELIYLWVFSAHFPENSGDFSPSSIRTRPSPSVSSEDHRSEMWTGKSTCPSDGTAQGGPNVLVFWSTEMVVLKHWKWWLYSDYMWLYIYVYDYVCLWWYLMMMMM